MSVMAWVACSLLAVVAVFWLMVFLVVRRVTRAVQGSPTVRRVLLRGRAGIATGLKRKALMLRLDLVNVLESGRAAIADLSMRHRSSPELRRLSRQLQDAGAALDGRLRLLESETDPAVVSEELPVLAKRVEDVARMVGLLRSVARDGLADDDEFAVLSADFRREVAAETAGARVFRDLMRKEAR